MRAFAKVTGSMFKKHRSFLLPEGEPSDTRVRVATAVILLEMAHADEHFDEREEETISEILRDFFHLGEKETRELLRVSDSKRRQSIDMWHFTKTINQEVSGAEKERIVEQLWRVVYADGRLDKYEDFLVHKLARVLHVSHAEMINAKMRVIQEDRRQGKGL